MFVEKVSALFAFEYVCNTLRTFSCRKEKATKIKMIVFSQRL